MPINAFENGKKSSDTSGFLSNSKGAKASSQDFHYRPKETQVLCADIDLLTRPMIPHQWKVHK